MFICFDSPSARVVYDDRKAILTTLLRVERRAVSTFDTYLRESDEQGMLYLIRDSTLKKIKMDLPPDYHCLISQ